MQQCACERSLNHCVGPIVQQRRNGRAKRLGRLHVDDEFELCGLLNRQIGRISTLQDFVDVHRGGEGNAKSAS